MKRFFTFLMFLSGLGFVQAQCPSAGDIIITEYMANPSSVADEIGEYIELCNTTATDIDIAGWELSDDDSDSHIIAAGSLIVPSGDCIVICRCQGGNFPYGSSDYDIGSNDFQLANGADEIVVSCGGNVIDRINYTNGDPCGAGTAVEQISGDGTLDCSTNSLGNGEFGTPGFVIFVLPVDLTYFTAQSVGNSVNLNWATASEDGNDFFAIEQSKDGKGFREVGHVAGAGWAITPNEYSFTQEGVKPGTYYYRLRQVDFDGDFEYSPIVSVEVTSSNNGGAFVVYPTTVSSELTVEIPNTSGEDAFISIFNASGQEVYSQPVGQSGTITINVNELTPGAYFIQFKNGTSFSTGRFFRL